jgi:hypothetical protein
MTMPISNAQPPVDNPVALIRSKMAAKRVFEARFLFRQLGDAIGTNEKMALAEELAAILSRAEQLLQRARACAAGGERSRAAELYREIEGIVIDMPGVAEESKSLTGAAALMAKITATAAIDVDPDPPAEEPAEVSEVDEEQPPPGAYSRQRSWWLRPLWLAACLIVIGAALGALWLGFPEHFSSTPFPPPAQPAKNIVIRPLVSASPAVLEKASPEPSPPVVVAQPVEKTAEPATPPPVPANPPAQEEKPPIVQAPVRPAAINLGVLRIEASRKR